MTKRSIKSKERQTTKIVSTEEDMSMFDVNLNNGSTDELPEVIEITDETK